MGYLLQYMAFMLCTGLHDFLALAVFDPAFTVWSSNVGKLSYTIGIPPCNFSAVDRSEPEWERESSYSYLYCTGQLVLVTPSYHFPVMTQIFCAQHHKKSKTPDHHEGRITLGQNVNLKFLMKLDFFHFCLVCFLVE